MPGPYSLESVDAQKLDEVHRTFTGYLYDSLGLNPRWSASLGLTTTLPTRGSSAKAKMATRAGGVHEWDDEREFGEVKFQDYEVTVKRYADALKLKMDDLDDDDMNLGLYRPQISELGDDFDEHKHQLVVQLLVNGDSTVGYDGVNFFATTHPVEVMRMDGGQTAVTPSTVSNLETGALTHTTLYAAIRTMMKMRKPNGMLANVIPTHIIAPVALNAQLDYILKSDTVVDATNGTKSNPLKSVLTPIIDPRLDLHSTTAYYLWDSTKPLKPIFMADRKPVTPQIDLTGDFNREIRWGAWARYNFGYGFYQSLLKSTGV